MVKRRETAVGGDIGMSQFSHAVFKPPRRPRPSRSAEVFLRLVLNHPRTSMRSLESSTDKKCQFKGHIVSNPDIRSPGINGQFSLDKTADITGG